MGVGIPLCPPPPLATRLRGSTLYEYSFLSSFSVKYAKTQYANNFSYSRPIITKNLTAHLVLLTNMLLKFQLDWVKTVAVIP